MEEKPNGQRVIRRRTERRRKLIQELHRKGFSHRQIMRRLHYKSVASIAYYLKGRKSKQNHQ